MDWLPLLGFPIEWAALALLVVACLYWERSGYSGLGVEGCVAAAMLGLLWGYESTGHYALACLMGGGAAVVFAVIAGILLAAVRVDPAVGAFALSLVPGCALALTARMGTFRLLTESPPPGLIRGTVLDGTVVEDLLTNPWLLTAPLLIALGGWILWNTPFGLRLRAFGENPAWRVPGSRPALTRLLALVVGALYVLPAVALLARAHPEGPPIGLGYLALACAIAGRWRVMPGILLALGPALVRTARPYTDGMPEASIALELAPFLLAILYLVVLSRRALRLAVSPRIGTDPDVL